MKGLCGEFSEKYYVYEELIKGCAKPSELNILIMKIKNNKIFSNIEKTRLKKRIKSKIKYFKNKRS